MFDPDITLVSIVLEKGNFDMKKTMQSRFNTAMVKGRSLTTKQVSAIGFANPYDAAYRARTVHGLNVWANTFVNSRGQQLTSYSLV